MQYNFGIIKLGGMPLEPLLNRPSFMMVGTIKKLLSLLYYN